MPASAVGWSTERGPLPHPIPEHAAAPMKLYSRSFAVEKRDVVIRIEQPPRSESENSGDNSDSRCVSQYRFVRVTTHLWEENICRTQAIDVGKINPDRARGLI